jgi:hypothetical protein
LISSRDVEDHRASLDAIGIGMAFGVAHRRLNAGNEIARVPFGWRRVGVGGEFVEIGDPAGADPAVLIDEGDDRDVIAGAAG